jgi:hypothetical protein
VDREEAAREGRPAGIALASLQRRLQAEMAARRELADEVAWLRSEVLELRESHQRASGEGASAAPGDSDNEARRGGADAARGSAAGPVFDEAALIAAGVSPGSARQARERWEENVLDRLYLNDRAAREGWSDSQQHWRELRLLDEQLRAELSDDEYDEYLFASGSANRVVVRDVTSGSAGAEIGLLPGDVIIRYDGQRVFATEDLKQATSGGSPGEPVTLEVRRDGGSIRTTVPRGPFGVFVTDETRPPSADPGRR